MPEHTLIIGREKDGHTDIVGVDPEGRMFVTDATLKTFMNQQTASFDLVIELLERLNAQMEMITGVQLGYGEKL